MKATHKARESRATDNVIHASSREECGPLDRARAIPIGSSSPRAGDPRKISASSPAELIVLVDDKNLDREFLARCLSTREGRSVAMFATVADCAQSDVNSAEPAFVLYNIHHRPPSNPAVEDDLARLGGMLAAAPLILLWTVTIPIAFSRRSSEARGVTFQPARRSKSFSARPV